MSDLETRITETAALLLDAARSAGYTVTADGRISEADCAALLGLTAGSLKNARAEGRAPAHYVAPVAGARISYRLRDVAIWLEARREDW